MASTVAVGSVIDHYKILEKIGKGGMGVVYKALNVYLDKYVALKTVALGLANEENFTKRFRTEARALARLQDPNIVSIYDLRADDDQWYIVMEYVEGITLAQMIRDYKAIPWQNALHIFKQMLSAIGHAHRAGIIHRDIKPNNVMVTANGIVKMTDFGLAKDQGTMGHTIAPTTGGTLYYMSPEQVKGLLFTDFRSDIYSLGLTLYEMLAGKIPFRKNDTDFSVREAIVKRLFPPPTQFNSKIPLGLNSIIMKAIEKDPDDRYQSVNDLLDDIEKFEQAQGLLVQEKGSGVHEVSADRTTDVSIFPQAVKNISYTQERPKNRKSLSDAQRFHINLASNWKKIAAFIIIPALIFAIIIGYNLNYPQTILKEIDLLFKANVEPPIPSKGSVVFDVQPIDANIKIDGKYFNWANAQSLALPAGIHDIILHHPDYQTIEDRFEVIQNTDQKLTYHLHPRSSVIADHTGVLKVESRPSGAAIYIGSQYIGTTPYYHGNFTLGEYQLKIRKTGYEEYQQQVNVSSNQSAKIYVNLISLTGSLKIESHPDNASIWIDDELIKNHKTPYSLNKIPLGKHTIRIHKEGYAEFMTEIITKKSEEELVSAKLNPLFGELNILVKPWGSIYVNESLKKKDTNVRYKQSLLSGTHMIKVTHPSFGVWKKEIQIEPNKSRELLVDFNKSIRVPVTAFDTEGEPLWAEIIVDDTATGETTPKEIDIRVGLHTIAAQKEGYILVNGEKQFMIDTHISKPLKFIFRKVN